MTAVLGDPAVQRRTGLPVVGGRGWPYGINSPTAQAQLVRWADALQVRYSERGRCLHWLTRGMCAVAECRAGRVSYQFMDHITGWTRNGSPALLVCQPYDLATDDLRDLVEVAEEWQVRIRIEGTRWYGYGTTFIALWRHDVPAHV